MKLTVVGCAGSFPSAASPASCYLVEHDGTRAVLDLGNGSLGPLQGHVDLDSVDAVVLSHLHIDHCADIASWYVHRKHRPGPPPDRRLVVYGPEGTAQRVAQIYGLADPPYEWLDFRDVTSELTVGELDIRTIRADHPVEAYSIRVSGGGRSLVYSGDTAATTHLSDLARGANVALFEASFIDGDNPPHLHMSAREAGEVARAAEVERLVLTHLVAWNDPDESLRQGAEGFAAAPLLARSGLVLDV